MRRYLDLLSDISSYIESGAVVFTKQEHESETFNSLALQLAIAQYREIPAYRQWVEFKREDPYTWTHWSQILPFPISLFKHMDVSFPGLKEKEWLSSGTTSSNRSKTGLINTDLYKLVIKRESHDWMGGDLAYIPYLVSLMPRSTDWPSSSLAFMFDEIFNRAETSGRLCQVAVDVTESRFELDIPMLESTLEVACENDVPLLLFGTSYAFIKAFEQMKGKYRLHPLSVLVDTGGYKGIVEDRTREQFLTQAVEKLGLNVLFVNEYGMSELSSQFWSLTGYSDRKFESWRSPYWVRTRVVNPVTLEEDPEGVLVVYDLANAWVPMAVQTEDKARVSGASLWPLGRVEGAVAKGCSLVVESALTTLETRGTLT